MPKSKITAGQIVKLDQKVSKKKKTKQPNASVSGGVSAQGGAGKKSKGSTPGRRQSIEPLRQQLNILVEEANRRVVSLQSEGLASRALSEAERTAIRFHKENGEITSMFTSQLPRMRDLAREFARVQTFLSDETSTVSGARRDKDDIVSGLFGGQYRAMYGTGYDITRVSKEQGDLALEVYHKVLERGGGWERVISHLRAINTGLTQYGSEELIQQIYDMVTSEEYAGYDADALTAVAYAHVEAIIAMNDEIAERQRMGINYGLLGSAGDTDKYDRYMWNEYRRKLKGE